MQTLHAATDLAARSEVALTRRDDEVLALFRTAQPSQYRVVPLDAVQAEALTYARVNGAPDALLQSLAQPGDVLVSTHHPGD